MRSSQWRSAPPLVTPLGHSHSELEWCDARRHRDSENTLFKRSMSMKREFTSPNVVDAELVLTPSGQRHAPIIVQSLHFLRLCFTMSTFVMIIDKLLFHVWVMCDFQISRKLKSLWKSRELAPLTQWTRFNSVYTSTWTLTVEQTLSNFIPTLFAISVTKIGIVNKAFKVRFKRYRNLYRRAANHPS